MTTFEYKGYDTSGRSAAGLIEALDLKDAREKLAQRGVLPKNVALAGAPGALPGRRSRVLFRAEMRAMLYRELAHLLRAGLTLTAAMEVLIQSPEMGASRPILAGLRDQVREGTSFADALASASKQVTPFETAAFRVGERTGDLALVLDRLALFLEEQHALRERIGTACIYPVIILVLAIIVSVVVFGILLPSVERLMEETRIAMPALTRFVLASGSFISKSILPTLILFFLGGWWAKRRWRTHPPFRVRINRLVCGLPYVGPACVALLNLRFSRTLAMLLEGGVSLIEALPLAGQATGSPWVEGLVAEERERVRHGDNLADAVARIPPLSGSLPGWIRAGEAGGNLAQLLDSSGTRYQQQWDRAMSRAIAVVEPALIIIVGLLVLVLALAILLPVLSLNTTLG